MQRGFVAVQSSQAKPLLPDMTEVLLHKWLGQGMGQRAHLGSLWYIDAHGVSLQIFSSGLFTNHI